MLALTTFLFSVVRERRERERGGGKEGDHTLFLADMLGSRMEREMDGKLQANASLCYICSGNVERFVESL